MVPKVLWCARDVTEDDTKLIRSIYDLYFGVNSTILYIVSCDLTVGLSNSGKKSSSLSLYMIFNHW